MKTLEEFQNDLIRAMQRLGEEPTLEAVEAAGRELVAGGIPPGANLEGMLLLRDRARTRALNQETSSNDDSRSGTHEPRRPR